MSTSPIQPSMSPRVSPVHSTPAVASEPVANTAAKVAQTVSSAPTSPSTSVSKPNYTSFSAPTSPNKSQPVCLFDEFATREMSGEVIADGEIEESEFSAIYAALAEAALEGDAKKVNQILTGDEFQALITKHRLSQSQASAAILGILGKNWGDQSREIFDFVTDSPAFPDVDAEDLPFAFDFTPKKPMPASKEQLEFFEALMTFTANDDLSSASIHSLAHVAAWNGDWTAVHQLLALPNARNLYDSSGISGIPSLRNLAYQAGQWKIYSQLSYSAAAKKCTVEWNRFKAEAPPFFSQKLSSCTDWFSNHRKPVLLTLGIGGALFLAYLYAPAALPVDPSSAIGTGTGLIPSATGTASISPTATGVSVASAAAVAAHSVRSDESSSFNEAHNTEVDQTNLDATGPAGSTGDASNPDAAYPVGPTGGSPNPDAAYPVGPTGGSPNPDAADPAGPTGGSSNPDAAYPLSQLLPLPGLDNKRLTQDKFDQEEIHTNNTNSQNA